MSDPLDPADLESPPSYWHVPDRDGSLLAAVKGVAGKVGRTQDAAQDFAVDVLTSSWSDLRPAALESAVISSRQNLKTYCMENIALAVMTMPERRGLPSPKLAVWSAHEVATAQETFLAFLDLAERYEWLGSKIVAVSRATGREGITFTGGRRLRFRARIKTGGRGLAGDVIFLDEAFALEPEHMGSLLPILSTRRFGRVIYGSSAPLLGSDILRRLIDRGRSGGPGAPAYVEWSAPGSLDKPGCQLEPCSHEPGTPGCALDDEDLWRAANPAIGARRPNGITIEYVRGERTALPPAEFARERLGWGESPKNTFRHPLLKPNWLATATDDLPEPGRSPRFFITIGVQGDAVIASAFDHVRVPFMPVPHVELADHRDGSDWLPDRLAELAEEWPAARFAAGKAGPVKGLVEAGLPVEVDLLAPGDLAQACRHHEKLHARRGYTHSRDGALDASLQGAVSKLVGDGLWTWDWKVSSALAPIAAVTGALWLLEKHREDDYDLLDSFG